MCRVVDTVLIDQETIYAPRHGNDRLLLGLKGSLNEYELDLLRQRSLSARYEKARRGECGGASRKRPLKLVLLYAPDSSSAWIKPRGQRHRLKAESLLDILRMNGEQ